MQIYEHPVLTKRYLQWDPIEDVWFSWLNPIEWAWIQWDPKKSSWNLLKISMGPIWDSMGISSWDRSLWENFRLTNWIEIQPTEPVGLARLASSLELELG